MDQNGFNFNDTVGGFTESKPYESVGGFGEYEDAINKAVGSFADAGVSRYEAPEEKPVKQKSLNWPIVTILLVLANLAVVVFNIIADETHISTASLNFVYISKYHEFGRLISSMFLHHNMVYFFSNMVALTLLGNEVEKRIGSLRTMIIYLVSGLGSGGVAIIVSNMIKPHQLNYYYGASGAIFGIACAYFFLDKRENGKTKLVDFVAAIILTIIFAVIAFMRGSVELATNISGIVLGAVCALLLGARKHSNTKEKLVFKIIGVVLCLGLCGFGVLKAKSDEYAKRFVDPRVEIVKDMEVEVRGEQLFATYGQALEYYCTDVSWEGFYSTDGDHVVEFVAKAPIDGKECNVLLQFTLDEDWKSCKAGYFEIDGEQNSRKERNNFLQTAAREYLLNVEL